MKRFETSIQADDLMLQSQKKGAYAKERLLAHLPQYGLFTLKRHPRLYGGTGTVALFRYLGLERICNCLDVLWGSGLSRGNAVHEDCPYTSEEKAIGASVQIVSWLILAGGYGLVLMGLWNGFRFVGACREDSFFQRTGLPLPHSLPCLAGACDWPDHLDALPIHHDSVLRDDRRPRASVRKTFTTADGISVSIPNGGETSRFREDVGGTRLCVASAYPRIYINARVGGIWYHI